MIAKFWWTFAAAFMCIIRTSASLPRGQLSLTVTLKEPPGNSSSLFLARISATCSAWTTKPENNLVTCKIFRSTESANNGTSKWQKVASVMKRTCKAELTLEVASPIQKSLVTLLCEIGHLHSCHTWPPGYEKWPCNETLEVVQFGSGLQSAGITAKNISNFLPRESNEGSSSGLTSTTKLCQPYIIGSQPPPNTCTWGLQTNTNWTIPIFPGVSSADKVEEDITAAKLKRVKGAVHKSNFLDKELKLKLDFTKNVDACGVKVFRAFQGHIHSKRERVASWPCAADPKDRGGGYLFLDKVTLTFADESSWLAIDSKSSSSFLGSLGIAIGVILILGGLIVAGFNIYGRMKKK